MSNKLAIIDADGVLANSDARFAQATVNGKVDWKRAFDPAAVSLDTLIEGVGECLDKLVERGHAVVILTSRPESMRAATVQWLAEHGITHHNERLEMKPASAQFVKTVRWKAERVVALAQEY